MTQCLSVGLTLPRTSKTFRPYRPGSSFHLGPRTVQGAERLGLAGPSTRVYIKSSDFGSTVSIFPSQVHFFSPFHLPTYFGLLATSNLFRPASILYVTSQCKSPRTFFRQSLPSRPSPPPPFLMAGHRCRRVKRAKAVGATRSAAPLSAGRAAAVALKTHLATRARSAVPAAPTASALAASVADHRFPVVRQSYRTVRQR